MSERESSLSSWNPSWTADLFAPWSASAARLGPLDESGASWTPSMDVCEDPDQFTVTLELAGGRKEDVTVELHENVVAIRGEKRSERDVEEEQPCYVERNYGSFSRSFALPPKADGDAIHAYFANGVLTVAIPKREEKKPQTIAVK